jgi:hypothetical protein
MTPVRLALALVLIGMGATVARGQGQATDEGDAVSERLVNRIDTAFTDGDAQQLLTPAADRVEVSLFGTRTFYSSAQAFYVLDDFFERHPPTRFELGDVTRAGQSCFIRGQFGHSRGERTLQVYVRLVRREAAWHLQEVRIDADVE